MAPSAPPAHATLLRDFANTVEHEGGAWQELLDTPAALTGWLRERALLEPDDTAGTDDAVGTDDRVDPDHQAAGPADEQVLALARDLRAGLRAAFVVHHGGEPRQCPEDEPPSPEALIVVATGGRTCLPDDVTGALPLQVDLAEGVPRLRPAVDGVRAGLARLLVAVADAGADGSWDRLKICVSDDCFEAFYDASKNQSRTWCDMGVCGNRAKTRAYRSRHRPESRPVG